jgi:hypothetical protein
MITEQDKLECEIIAAIRDSFDSCPEDFSFSENDILAYLDECFAAKKMTTKTLPFNEIDPFYKDSTSPEIQ